MKIVAIFAQERDYPDEGIELLTAWDEYCIDGNPEGFEEDVRKNIEARGGHDDLDVRQVVIEIDERTLESAFKHPLITGKLVSFDIFKGD